MKRYFLSMLMVLTCALSAQAQEKLIPMGTDVPVVAEQQINAYELTEGQIIELRTASDVKLSTGEIAIPKGSLVNARVRTGLHQRVLANQKRRLIIELQEVVLANGDKIALSNGVASFTTGKSTGGLKATHLRYVSPSKYLIPTDYVMHAKVDVSYQLEK